MRKRSNVFQSQVQSGDLEGHLALYTYFLLLSLNDGSRHKTDNFAVTVKQVDRIIVNTIRKPRANAMLIKPGWVP